ncbi:MAG: T9SS type B sorting domain-containing protein [Crocinitomicaceae bacterium]|nr:MAG: T9SS type B sorting domain-containing protein [Crocinitomicaceae bacterium]
MKLLVLIFFSMFFLTVVGQEIEHKHSVHHAFIENKGQWSENILFKTRFQGGNLWVEQGKLLFHLQNFTAYQKAHGNPLYVAGSDSYTQHVVHLNFAGSNTVHNITKEKPTEAYYNYFLGNNKNKWASGVRGYSEATLHDLYNGIDFKLIEENEELKYEFHVLPGTNPSIIKLDYAGHNKLEIDKSGNLLVKTPLGIIQEKKPYAYQIKNGKIVEVACAFEINESMVRFKLGNYDPQIALIIDPTLVFATYSGSVTDNFGMTATYGYDGTAYSAGTIYGNAYPTPDPAAYDVTSNFTVQNVSNSITTDAFISKYAADGTTMLWTTFLGGGNNVEGTETSHSLICDQNNNVYIYGVTSSTDFPIQGGFQSSHGGGSFLNINSNGTNFGNTGTDIFVAKISANGQSLLASTYIGGSGNDGANYNISGGTYPASAYDSLTTNYGDQFRGEIMVDAAGNCIIASCTRSTNFPTQSPIQTANAGMQDGVIFKLNNTLSSLIFSTYIGGSKNDACYSVKIDSSFNIVFSGGTNSTNLPGTTGAWQSTHNGGKADGFVGKLNPTGTVLQRISYVGTSNYDQAFFVEIDRNDNVFLLGQSLGGLFPVTNASYSNPSSGQFIAKMSPDLSTMLNSTVFGNGNSNINISPSAFLVDNCGNIYVSGWGANILQSTPLSGMAVTPDAFQGNSPNGFDFYLMVLNRTFSTLLYGTYLGGTSAGEHVDGGTSRFDKNGVVYQSVCGGCGGFSDFPTSSNAWSNTNLSSNCNNIIFKFDFEITPKAEFTADQTSGCAALDITFNNTSSEDDTYIWNFGNGNLDSTTFNPQITYTNPGVYDVYLYVTDSICQITDTAKLTITVYDSLMLDLVDTIQLCVPSPLTLTGNSFGTATEFHWSTNNQFTDQLNANLSDSTLIVTPQTSTIYYLQISNPDCSIYDSVVVEFISSSLELSGDDGICAGEQTTITATNQNPAISFNYVWSPASIIVNQPTANTVTVNPPTSQYVYVTASSSNGCVVEDSLFITVSNLGNVAVVASADQYLVPPSTSVVLTGTPSSGYSFTWSPTTGMSNSTLAQTNALIEETTTYTYTLSDPFCSKSDTVQVKVLEYICGDEFVYIPNAFSPNGDGDNDILYVRSKLIDQMIFRIFDRWGELVFESTSRADGWDGTFKGKPCDPDVYDYYLKGTCVGGEETLIKGNITLLK